MQQHYTNDTDAPKYVGGKLIPPGETRLVDLPTAAAPAAAEPEADALAHLSKRKVSEIVAALPALTSNDIDQLLALERAQSKPRSTLVEALELRKLEIISMFEQPPAGSESGTDSTTDATAPQGDVTDTGGDAGVAAADAPQSPQD